MTAMFLKATAPDINVNARPARLVRRFRPFLRAHPIVAVDIGARAGPPGAWTALLPHLHLVALEPDPEEAARLRDALARRGPAHFVVLPEAAGPGGEQHILHVARDPGKSSLLAPATEVVERYGRAEEFDVVATREVTTRSLASILAGIGVDEPDLLKLDVQGFELEVLRSLHDRQLDGLLLVESEVEFVALYQGQPLFRHVDEFLAGRGFELFHLNRTFANYHGRRWQPYGRGQLQYADAFYLRSRTDGLSAARMAKLIFLACYHGFSDYGAYLFARERERLRELGEAMLAPFHQEFAAFDRKRPTLAQALGTGAVFLLDRLLLGYLVARRWNHLRVDNDRDYPTR